MIVLNTKKEEEKPNISRQKAEHFFPKRIQAGHAKMPFAIFVSDHKAAI